MSGRRALLLSLLALLRGTAPAGLGLRESECGLTSRGRPPAMAGTWFYGLAGAGGKWGARTSLLEQPRAAVTVTGRVKVGSDKIGLALLEAEDGLDDRMGALVALLARQQYVWANAANALLGPQTNGFVHPAFDFDEGEPREVGADWFLAGPATPGLKTAPGPAGLTSTLQISGFLRERYIESAT